MQNTLSELNAKNPNPEGTANTGSGLRLQLDAPGVATKIAARIKDDIDAYCVQTYDGGHRTHLGASLIGRSCKRYLWYVFRWAKRAPTDGRRQRLFNRGHREEARFIEWLEGIGFKIWFENRDGLYYHPESHSYFIHDGNPDTEADPDFCISHPITESTPNYAQHIAAAKFQGLEFPQYRISDCNGHFGGSLDAIIQFPPHWGIDEACLGEFKTHGTGSKFEKLKEKRMPLEKPDHFAQTSTYGVKYRFRFVVYFSINKNDDDLHIEIAKLDWNLGEQMLLKADQIISSQTAPAKLSESPTFQDCRYCDMADVCHSGASMEKNCRSCVHASPVANAQWHCALYSATNGPIPKDVIPVGCPDYKAIA
jgi:hypothetical protein